MRLSTLSTLVLVLAGCDLGILDPILTSGHSGDSESGPPAMTSTATSDTSTGGSDTTGLASETCTTCDSATEAVFIVPPEPPPACDVYAQDCPSGFKCTAEGPPPLDFDNITCSAIVPDPDQAGESCQRLVQGHFGPDTCDLGLFCDDIDPQTGTGTCAVICQGSDHQPICGADEECFGYHQMPLCVPHCDPLLQDCPAGDSCQYAGVDFVCLKVDGLPGNQLFEGCGGDWRCAPGLSCADGDVATECVLGGEGPGCCSPYCDLSAPACPGVGQQCRPYYEPGEAPSGLENVGVCALP
ncbi:hypothetical protein OV203_39390 [Nannocystis sp. ILAH1]|uniref:hypothetical protein n=1 Tax=unclassified Nannocystis TaxID=2627009 RepID=UPI00226D75D8|nr:MULTISPECIES: hypothetical protein [unclassified Nannocystis]MCY0993270.1 hypothetical protein [Nannocystis sp. ILAH1]MCY1063297.1 hypothetical protein [Nannocystis sp. RBIL2]